MGNVFELAEIAERTPTSAHNINMLAKLLHQFKKERLKKDFKAHHPSECPQNWRESDKRPHCRYCDLWMTEYEQLPYDMKVQLYIEAAGAVKKLKDYEKRYSVGSCNMPEEKETW